MTAQNVPPLDLSVQVRWEFFATPEEIAEAKRALDAIREHQAHMDREVSTIHMIAMTINQRMCDAAPRIQEKPALPEPKEKP